VRECVVDLRLLVASVQYYCVNVISPDRSSRYDHYYRAALAMS